MTTQYEFFNRDLLEEACNLRLTGSKDLLHHFVKNNARNFEPDTTKDEVWEAMAEITINPGTSNYAAREELRRAFSRSVDPRLKAATDYISQGDFSRAVTTLMSMVVYTPELTKRAQKLNQANLLYTLQSVADRLRLKCTWPTEWLEQQYVWAIENDADALRNIRYRATFCQHCGTAISAIVRKIASEAGFTAPRGVEMNYIVAEVNRRILGRPTGVRYMGPVSPTGRLTDSQPEFQEFPPTTEKEETMSTKPVVPFETVHYVYGTDVATMTDDQLVEAIKQVEAEIAKLDVVKTQSKKIDAKKAELKDMLAKIVETLDGR